MKKALLSLLLIGMIVFAWAAVVAAEAAKPERIRSGDYAYILNGDGTATLVDFHAQGDPLTLVGGERHLVLPGEIDGIAVTGLGKDTFSYRNFHYTYRIEEESIEGLIILELPDSLTIIEANALFYFDGAAVSADNPTFEIIDGVLFRKSDKALIWYSQFFEAEEYIIPSGIEKIGDFAFHFCYNLTSIIFPDSVTNIGYSAFYDCSSLTSLVIPDGVKEIGDYAFTNCMSLNSIVIPDSVTEISDYLFCGCDGLTSIVIPDGVTAIGDRAFL